MSFGNTWGVILRRANHTKGEKMKGKLLQPNLDLYDPSKPIPDLWKHLALWGHHAYVIVEGR
jgi:hypothetical protein